MTSAGDGLRLTEAEREALGEWPSRFRLIELVERILADRAAADADNIGAYRAALRQAEARLADRAARRHADEGLRAGVEALLTDPYEARNNGELARYQQGVTRRGGVFYGEFVKAADLRALLAARRADEDGPTLRGATDDELIAEMNSRISMRVESSKSESNSPTLSVIEGGPGE